MNNPELKKNSPSNYCSLISIDEVGDAFSLKKVDNTVKYFTRKKSTMGQIMWSLVKCRPEKREKCFQVDLQFEEGIVVAEDTILRAGRLSKA